jgi:vancomycin permeability regulator SanA
MMPLLTQDPVEGQAFCGRLREMFAHIQFSASNVRTRPKYIGEEPSIEKFYNLSHTSP